MIKAGDRVKIKGEDKIFHVRTVIDHPNFKVGPDTFTIQRVYFVEDHQPEFEWRITEILGNKDDE